MAPLVPSRAPTSSEMILAGSSSRRTSIARSYARRPGVVSRARQGAPARAGADGHLWPDADESPRAHFGPRSDSGGKASFESATREVAQRCGSPEPMRTTLQTINVDAPGRRICQVLW